MNNFKQVAKLTHKMREEINSLYDEIDENKKLNKSAKKILKICSLSDNKEHRLAVLKRLLSLKEENLLQILDDKTLKYKIYKEVASFYKKRYEKLIKEISKQNLLDDFYIELIKTVHKIGLIMNKFFISWDKKILCKNANFLENKFKNLEEILNFLQDNNIYQKDSSNNISERTYGAMDIKKDKIIFLPYALAFKKEFLKIKNVFNKKIKSLEKKCTKNEHKKYLVYIKKLKKALLQTNNDKVISSWQEAELAWLKVKSPLQLGHPLEYYEDKFTKAVAPEWDLRLNEESIIKPEFCIQKHRNCFENIFNSLNLNDKKLKNEVLSNINKTQLYICSPMLYYGAELNGLFSAQVVPNDETVSNKGGKKIFAFINFVYENSKKAPFMQISSEIFDKNFLDFSRKILFKDEQKWKEVYEILTIGHEFGHIYFVAQDSEIKMNKSGYFKNIEEFKASAGGLMCFFENEKPQLKLAVFNEFIKRAVSLIAYQNVEEIKPYYTEALISLSILFKTKVLSFEEKLFIDFSEKAYERFKLEFIKIYKLLAQHYSQKLDAKEFLFKFCKLNKGIFLPIDEECEKFVLYYYNLYKKIANKIDTKANAKDYL